MNMLSKHKIIEHGSFFKAFVFVEKNEEKAWSSVLKIDKIMKNCNSIDCHLR